MRYIIGLTVKEKRAVPTSSGHGPRSEPPRDHAGLGSLVCRGTGELANRFRPQSLLARRAPPARPYLTPYHSAWGTCYHVRGHEGEMIRASRLESHAAAQRFLVSQSLHTLPPRSPDVRSPGSEEGRKRSSRRRGTPRSDTLQLRPSTGSTRSNAQAGTMASPSNPLCLSSSSQSRWVA